MNKIFFLIGALLTVNTVLYSQFKDKEVLLTLNEEPVYVDEFLRVYNKNIEMVQDESQKDKMAYLELFINYKLKVQEAFAQKLHQNPTFVKELNSYKDQLAKNYLYDQNITEELMLEAYERMQEEVNANHILIRLDLNSTPKDTLEAYKKIVEIREKALSGEDFVELAKQYSEEPNADERGGALGYFKGMGMVYPFETAAYNTPMGEISEIIRTQYGYHILKVNDRRTVPNEVTVAHIMIANNQGKEEEEALKRINEILNRVQQGEDFGDLARQFSEDPNTARKDGVLNRFGSGRLNAPAFEQAAFELKNPGDITEPVKTDFGWHIIKLIERHPKESYEEAKEELLRRVKNSDRSKIIVTSVNERIKEKYNFEEVENPLPFFNTFVSDSIMKRKWKKTSHPEKLNAVAFKIGNKETTFSDFSDFIENYQKSGPVSTQKELQLTKYYEDFLDQKLDEFFKLSLEEENPEYANLVNEYRDGLLIYDLMQKNIWEKSKNDSLGLENYFNNHKQNYKWNTRIKGLMASTSSRDIANQIKSMFEKGNTEEEIKSAFNTEEVVKVILTQGTFEMGNSILPDSFEAKTGVSKVYNISSNKNTNDTQFIVINTTEVIPSGFKEFNEVRGKVMSAYQNELESKWMEELREKYKFKVNKKALKKFND